jgi:hypothetical protein
MSKDCVVAQRSQVESYFHPDDPAGWLRPGEPFMVGGLDWSWTFVWYKKNQEFPGYCVGSNGTIWTKRARIRLKNGQFAGTGMGKAWRRMKPSTRRPRRHLHITVYNADGQRRDPTVHALILMTFLGDCPAGKECCHYDDNPQNNRLGNIRWDTHRANMDDATRNQRRRVGEANGRPKLTSSQVDDIRRLHRDGVQQKILAGIYGVHNATINRIVHGAKWRHTYGTQSSG